MKIKIKDEMYNIKVKLTDIEVKLLQIALNKLKINERSVNELNRNTFDMFETDLEGLKEVKKEMLKSFKKGLDYYVY